MLRFELDEGLSDERADRYRTRGERIGSSVEPCHSSDASVPAVIRSQDLLLLKTDNT